MVLLFTKLLLSGKNDLKKVWLAAHWERKLKRYHIFQIDIESSVKEMMSHEIILDLRLSGHLLVGIVKIFSRKTKYLLTECNDIFNRVRIFRANSTDLPPNKLQAHIDDITIPEAFEKFEDPDFGKLDDDGIFVSHQSRVEDITLKETFGNMRLINDDDDFDLLNLEDESSPLDFDADLQLISLLKESGGKENGNRKVSQNAADVVPAFLGGPRVGGDAMDCEGEVIVMNGDSDTGYCNGLEMMSGSDDSLKIFCHPKLTPHTSDSQYLIATGTRMKNLKETSKNELHLEPLSDILQCAGRIRRKRKLIIDEVKTLKYEKVEKQFYDTLDIRAPLDLAPPSKRLMILKEIGGSEQILHLPGQKMLNIKILNLFTQNLKSHKTESVDDSSCEEDTNSSISSFEVPKGDLIFNECSTVSNISNIIGFHDHAEGFDRNEIQLNTENSGSLTSDAGYVQEVNESYKEQLNFTNQFQLDISASENSMANVKFILQERIIRLLDTLELSFRASNSLKFSVLVQNDRRSKAAQKFLSLLMLKKFGIVELQQNKPYEEIFITQGGSFILAYNEICKN